MEAAPPCKERGKRGKERTYTLSQLRTALFIIAGNVARGAMPKFGTAAKAAGLGGCRTTVYRYAKVMLSVGRDEPAATAHEARRAFISNMDLRSKGNPNLSGKRLFTVDSAC